MHRTRIKICGVCRPEDAALAARAGADAIGMVLHPASPRNVPLDRAREIMAALPPFVTPVGVFVDAAIESVLRTVRELGLRHIQLNGSESAERVDELKPLIVIKAIRVAREHFSDELAVWREKHRSLKLTNLAGLVLETAGTSAPGGTGVANDWQTVRNARSGGDFEGLPPVIAAGGLTPESVGAVVRDLRPHAVDVSSGVEEAKGRKSPARVEAFVRAVRDADASTF